MVISGNVLPERFVRAIKNESLERKVGSWQLKKNYDSFGNELETELDQVWSTYQEILEANLELPKHFHNDGVYGQQSEYKDEPGFIEDIVDFTHIVEFSISGDGTPFCFDFRHDEEKPEIIWWDDVYWRKISGSFEDFISLFAGIS